MELDNAAPAKDVYVSVRVGDVQKFSKLSSKRGYKFPPSVLGNRYGRVELFRRVGTCSVAVDQSASKHVQQVAFPSVDGNTGTSIRVEVAPQEAAESSHEKKKGPNPKFASAREYLEKHQMEVRLAEAMQALLRERPDDPGAFVAAALQQSKDMVKVTAKEVPGKTTAEVAKSFDVVPFSRYYSVCFRSFPQEYWAQLGDSFRTRTGLPPLRAKSSCDEAKASQVPIEQEAESAALVPFSAYYVAHVRSCPNGSWSKIYGLFNSQATVAAPSVESPPFAERACSVYKQVASPLSAAKAVLQPCAWSFSDYNRLHLSSTPPLWNSVHTRFVQHDKMDTAIFSDPSAPSVSQALTLPSSVPFAEYYGKNVQVMSSCAWSGIYERFLTTNSGKVHHETNSVAAPAPVPWFATPSVGSWLLVSRGSRPTHVDPPRVCGMALPDMLYGPSFHSFDLSAGLRFI